jgi:hypothetical protein
MESNKGLWYYPICSVQKQFIKLTRNIDSLMEIRNDLQNKVTVFMVKVGYIICVLASDYDLADNDLGNRKAGC